jgi:hypothetical protein
LHNSSRVYKAGEAAHLASVASGQVGGHARSSPPAYITA